MHVAFRALVAAIAAIVTYLAALLASFMLAPSPDGLWRAIAALAVSVGVGWLTWSGAASLSGLKRNAAFVLLPIAAVLGFGLVRTFLYGSVYVDVNDVGLRTDRQLYESVSTADLVFRDAEGAVLARGQVRDRIASLIHPEVGDCRRFERLGQEAYGDCYRTQSRWFTTWVPRVQTATVRLEGCTIERVPVDVTASRDAWWLWWLPLPHLDNATRTHFTLNAWVDSVNCRPSSEREARR